MGTVVGDFSAMNCSDSTPGPVIVKYEDDVPQISGKPCIDFQPDDRWQIKDDEDCNVDNPGKKSLVNDTKKSKVHSDEKRLDAAVNGDSDKIDKVTVKEAVENTSSDSCVNVKENPVVQNDKESVNQLNEEEPTRSPTNAKINVDTEKMHDLSVCPVKVEHSGDDTVSTKNDGTSPLDVKEAENKNSASEKAAEDTTSVDEKEAKDANLPSDKPDAAPQDGEKSNISENSVTSEKDATIVSQNKQPQDDTPSSNDSTKGDAGSAEKSSNCDSEVSGSMPSSEAKTDKPEEEGSNSSKAAVEESPPKLENHLSSGTAETVSVDEDMPDISGSNSGAVVDTVSKNSDSTPSESSKEAAQKSDGTESEVQMISSSTDSVKKVVAKEQNNKSQEKTPHDIVLLNSLKGVLKAGQYKPVKFPHTGMLNLAENEVIIESPSLLVPLLIKEADVFPKAEDAESKTEETSKKQAKPPVSKNFFESSVGKFLISLGMGRVEEWYHRDMKKAKLKHIKKYGPDQKVEELFQMHSKEYLKAKEANSVFSFKMRCCQFCDFKSESLSVMEAHYLIPHLSPRKEYKCNFCVFFTRDPKEIIFHFEAMHGKKAVLDFIMPFHECPFCCFQSHLKTKVNAHINRCRKHFMPTHNQAPPFDFEFPGVTTKPVTMADVLAHRAIMNAAKSRPNQPVYTPPNAVPKGITVRNKLALINKLSNQNSVNNVQGSTLVKQLVSQQQPKPIQPVSAATGIQLPPGLVITRPRANLPQVQNSVRLTGPRITTATVRHQVNTRKWVYNSAESQLASSGISITPVTKVASQGVWTPNMNNAVIRPAMKNITVTPISSSSNQVVSQKPGPPQPVALFTNVAGNDSRNGTRGPVIMSVQSQAPRLPIGPKIGSPRIHIPYQRLNTPPSQVVKGSSGNTFVMCEICDSYIKDLEELRTHMNWVHKVKIHPKMLVSRPPLNCQKCQWRFFTDQGLERHLLGAHGLVTTNMQEMANKNQDGGRCIICGAVFTYKLVSHMTQVHKVTLKPAHLSYKCTVCTATFTLYRLFESHVYNVHSGSAKRPAEEQPASEPPSKKANIIVAAPPEPKELVQEVVLEKCKACDLEVEDLEEHVMKKHMKKCSVKVCHIEKCEKCLYSTDEILVIRMSDFGIEDDDDDSEDEDEDDDEDEGEITSAEIKPEVTESAPLESDTDKA